MRRFRGWVLAGLVAGVVPFASVAEAVPAELESHRAIYRMGLSTARSGSGMANASGLWTYQFNNTCDGWLTEFRLAITYSYSEGGQVETATDFLGWESKDGLRYRFRVRQVRDGQIVEEIEGTAKLNGRGQGGIARFTRPEAHVVRLPKGTLFPTAHTLHLLALAERGGMSLTRPLFDGQGNEGPFETSARIGRALAQPAAQPSATQPSATQPSATQSSASQPAVLSSPLLNSPAWPMRLAFFPTGSTDPLPEFEMSLTYHANGVAQDIEQIFRTFSLRGQLESIESLPRPRC